MASSIFSSFRILFATASTLVQPKLRSRLGDLGYDRLLRRLWINQGEAPFVDDTCIDVEQGSIVCQSTSPIPIGSFVRFTDTPIDNSGGSTHYPSMRRHVAIATGTDLVGGITTSDSVLVNGQSLVRVATQGPAMLSCDNWPAIALHHQIVPGGGSGLVLLAASGLTTGGAIALGAISAGFHGFQPVQILAPTGTPTP